MGVLLFIIAYILLLPLTIFNFFVVLDRKYFLDTAINIDKFGNRELRASLNKYLITKDSKDRFGVNNETISSVLGKNQQNKRLTKLGICISNILDFLDKNHCRKSITYNY